LFTIFIIVVTQKLVLQQSKNVIAKCTETLLPPPYIQYLLDTSGSIDCHVCRDVVGAVLRELMNQGKLMKLQKFEIPGAVCIYIYMIV